MKKMKRLVAVLLAGVMVLAMLTACGGGSSTPTINEEKVEALYMDIYNAALGADHENDAELEKLAKQTLVDSLDENGALNSGKKMTVRNYDKNSSLKVWTTVTILAQPENENVPYGITSKELAETSANKEKAIDEARKNVVNMGNNNMEVIKKTTTGFAVGAVKKGDKIYVAIAMKTDMNLK